MAHLIDECFVILRYSSQAECTSLFDIGCYGVISG